MSNNTIVRKAVEIYLEHVGELGCIGDRSCECFKCQLSDFALDEDRRRCGHAHDFSNEMCRVRNELEQISAGEIERGHCVGRAEAYGGKRGMRKLMLKDAVSIARSCMGAINNAINRFMETDL